MDEAVQKLSTHNIKEPLVDYYYAGPINFQKYENQWSFEWTLTFPQNYG